MHETSSREAVSSKVSLVFGAFARCVLLSRLLAIGIQRVINRRLSFEQLVIILVDQSKPFGDRLKSA